MRMFRSFIAVTNALLAISSSVYAQVPKYPFTNYPQPSGQSLGSFGFDAYVAQKLQCIFYPANFAGMPTGAVRAVYVKVGRNVTGVSPYTYTNFMVKMGYTNDSTFPNNSNKIDTFKTGLTTVYGPANFTATGIDSIGRWVRIPLTTGSFTYRPESKFVFEISHGAKSDGTGFYMMASHPVIAFKYRLLGGHLDSTRVGNGASPGILDFGIDLVTTGVEAAGNVSSFGLFPNPSTDGRFNVSFETARPVGEATITVSSVTGQQVLRQVYSSIGTSFFKEVALHDVAKGVYLVEVMAGSDRIVRRVVVQ